MPNFSDTAQDSARRLCVCFANSRDLHDFALFIMRCKYLFNDMHGFLVSIVNPACHGFRHGALAGVLRAHEGSFCILTPDRAIAKNRAYRFVVPDSDTTLTRDMRPQLRSSSLPSSGLFLALSRAGYECMHWRASSAHHRCLGPFGATRVLVTHHRLHLLELLQVEVSTLAAQGEHSTRRTQSHCSGGALNTTHCRGTQTALREAI